MSGLETIEKFFLCVLFKETDTGCINKRSFVLPFISKATGTFACPLSHEICCVPKPAHLSPCPLRTPHLHSPFHTVASYAPCQRGSYGLGGEPFFHCRHTQWPQTQEHTYPPACRRHSCTSATSSAGPLLPRFIVYLKMPLISKALYAIKT